VEKEARLGELEHGKGTQKGGENFSFSVNGIMGNGFLLSVWISLANRLLLRWWDGEFVNCHDRKNQKFRLEGVPIM